MKLGRRQLLKGIAAGTLSLTYAGVVSAGGQTRYLVETANGRARDRLEDAGFTVQRAIADGDVLLVIGPSGGLDQLQGVRGVSRAIEDHTFELEAPQEQVDSSDLEFGLPEIDEDLNPYQWDKDVTDVPEAHETATGDGTSVAIIDTGVGLNHPWLGAETDKLDATNGRRVRSLKIGSVLDPDYALVSGGLAADPFASGTGDVETPVDRDDPSQGTIVKSDEVENDVDGHGTNVAGIAAARPYGDDDLGGLELVTGTAPDATIVPIRVFYWLTQQVQADEDEELEEEAALFTTTGDILMAIDYAASLGVDAMNMSIGTAPIPPQGNAGGAKAVYQTVIESATRRGSLVVVSSGNSGWDLQRKGYFTLPNSVAGAMSISATGPNDEMVFYSNYGTNEISVGAPGGGYETLKKTLCDPDDEEDEAGDTGIWCADMDDDGEEECATCTLPPWAFPFNLVFNTYQKEASDDDTLLENPTFSWLAGTSMAAPQVTGAAALVREIAPNANAKQVEQALEQGAELVQGKNDPELGAGRLSAAGALDAVTKGP